MRAKFFNLMFYVIFPGFVPSVVFSQFPIPLTPEQKVWRKPLVDRNIHIARVVFNADVKMGEPLKNIQFDSMYIGQLKCMEDIDVGKCDSALRKWLLLESMKTLQAKQNEIQSSMKHEGLKRAHAEIELLYDSFFPTGLMIRSTSFKDTDTTRLMELAEAGDLVKVKSLMANDGQLVNATDQHGRNALMYAVKGLAAHNDIHCAGYIVSEDNEIYGDWEGVLAFLIKHSTDLNVQDFEGKTALSMAATAGLTDAIILLTEAHADINHGDIDGETPLMLAVEKPFHSEAVKSLLQAGADPNVLSHFNEYALLIAVEENCEDIETIQLLVACTRKTSQQNYRKIDLPYAAKITKCSSKSAHDKLMSVLAEQKLQPDMSRYSDICGYLNPPSQIKHSDF